MTKPKNASPPLIKSTLTLEDRARRFLSEKGAFAPAVELLAIFADQVLGEAERAVTDQHRRPDKLSRIYWQSRMDAGREIHELRRGRLDTIVPRPNAEIDECPRHAGRVAQKT